MFSALRLVAAVVAAALLCGCRSQPQMENRRPSWMDGSISKMDAELTAKYGDLKSFFSDVKMSGGHEQTIVGVANGDFDAGVSWADGNGNWEDGYDSGAFRKAADAGLVDMNNLVEIWRSSLIPEGPMVVRKALPADVKDKVTTLTADLWETDKDCAYGVAAGEAKDFVPVEAKEYDGILAARKMQEGT